MQAKKHGEIRILCGFIITYFLFLLSLFFMFVLLLNSVLPVMFVTSEFTSSFNKMKRQAKEKEPVSRLLFFYGFAAK